MILIWIFAFVLGMILFLSFFPALCRYCFRRRLIKEWEKYNGKHRNKQIDVNKRPVKERKNNDERVQWQRLLETLKKIETAKRMLQENGDFFCGASDRQDYDNRQRSDDTSRNVGRKLPGVGFACEDINAEESDRFFDHKRKPQKTGSQFSKKKYTFGREYTKDWKK